MAKGAYIGVSSVTKKIKKFYIGSGGVAHAVKKAYIGVNGVARLFWSGGNGFVWTTTTDGNYPVRRDYIRYGESLSSAKNNYNYTVNFITYLTPLCVWNGKVYASGTNGVYYSTNKGQSWTLKSYKYSNYLLGSLHPTSDYLCILSRVNGGSYYTIAQLTKSDTWTNYGLGGESVTTMYSPIVSTSDRFYFLTYHYSVAVVSVPIATLGYPTSVLQSVTNPLLISNGTRIVCQYGSNVGYINGSNFVTSFALSTIGTLKHFTYWNGKFYVYGTSKTAYSSDGINWQFSTSVIPLTSTGYGSYYAMEVPMSNYSNETLYYMYKNGYIYSKDGLTWTVVNNLSYNIQYILDNPQV